MSFSEVQLLVMFDTYLRQQKWEFLVILRLIRVSSQKRKCNSTSRQLSPKENHTGTFTVVKTTREVTYLFRFSILMHILFIHIDTETFVHLTCTYTLNLWAFRFVEIFHLGEITSLLHVNVILEEIIFEND